MKPIIFSTPMVQAILDGRKTQTRRVIKAPVLRNVREPDEVLFDGKICKFNWHGDDVIGGFEIKPKYQPGDILWVRETWRVGAWNENTGCIAVDYKADGFARREWIEIKNPELFEQYWIQSTDDAVKAGLETDSDGQYHWEPGKGPTRWRPSIFMPREAARIFLRVTNVRVERLQEITEEDARAEGCSTKILNDGWKNIGTLTARDEFIALWEHLNAKRGLGWDRNPWVWVYEFEKISRTGGE